ncbi:MAG TPA: phosphate ABC transporter permease PstA [Bryobacteraceae bacterium]|nr:phosphate ABC transporter permease PstA [Bryobacteraceae bacterium]
MSFRNRWRKILSFTMLSLTGVCAVLAVSILFLILGCLVYNGWRSVDFNFFTQLPKAPGETGGGMANAIVGSFEIVFMATLIGLPIGFMAGVYLSEFGGRTFASLVRYMADLLNGVPSIVIGIFAWTLVVVPMHRFSATAGGVALALILIPITARSTEQFMNSVPQTLREGALALGASQWKTIATVVVPAAYRGIATGMILGVARIAGETAPLLFTSLNNEYWSNGLTQPTASLPYMIYTRALAPYEDWHRQAWAAGMVLLVAVLLANVAARLILSRGIAVQK